MKFEIKNRFDLSVIFSLETENFKICVEAAVSSRANLYGADLSGADLSGANLYEANLYEADLSGANLYGFFSFCPGGSRNAYTWARWEDGGYMVHCGCKTLELSEFKKLVAKTHGKTYHAQWYLANIKTMEIAAKASKADWEKYQKEKKS